MNKRLENIKLIVIDIDGTLVDSIGEIGDKTLHFVKELKKLNVLCTLSSARSYDFSKPLADQLEIDIPIVTLDGCLIKDRYGNVVFKSVIKDKHVRKSIKLAEDNYGKIALCGENTIFITPRNVVIREYSKLTPSISLINSYDEADNILQILIYCEDKSSLSIIKNGFGFLSRQSLNLSITKSPRNDYYLLTIKNKRSDKLGSVKKLVKHLGLRKEQVAVIGDWHNDMPLFEFGAFNIAVKNAIPELKRKADYITNSTNDEDAVGEALEIVLNSISSK